MSIDKMPPPPCGLLIGIYLFYENWSTETFRKKEGILESADSRCRNRSP
jgi:hypothetical protein